MTSNYIRAAILSSVVSLIYLDAPKTRLIEYFWEVTRGYLALNIPAYYGSIDYQFSSAVAHI
jgi:hypothetical protein